MEGSDGKVYIQSVIHGGPAHSQGNINTGDQIVAVNGRNLLSMKYNDALELLKSSGQKVEFVLAQISVIKSNSIYTQSTLPISELENKLKSRCQVNLSNINESHLKMVTLESTINKLKHMSYPNANLSYPSYEFPGHPSPVEKHVTESCHDITNPHKFSASSSNVRSDVPYHKHIRYGLESDIEIYKLVPFSNLNKTISKSCTHIYNHDRHERDKAVIVDMIPKHNVNLTRNNFIENKMNDNAEKEEWQSIPHIPLPRSLGLSRKWRGPVRYPVTPVKKSLDTNDDSSNYVTTSDEEQVFI